MVKSDRRLANLSMANILKTVSFGAALLAAPNAAATPSIDRMGEADTPVRCSLPSAQETAGPKRAIRSLDLVRLRDFGSTLLSGQPAILSPDKRTVALQLRQASPETNSYCTAIVLVSSSGNTPPVVLDDAGVIEGTTFYKYGISGLPLGSPKISLIRWNEESSALAYTKSRGGMTEVWIAHLSGGKPRRVFTSDTDVTALSWVNGGRSLALSREAGRSQAREELKQEGLAGFHYDERIWPLVSAIPYPRHDGEKEALSIDLETGENRPSSSAEALQLDAPARNGIRGARAFARSSDGRLAWAIAAQPKARRQPSLLHAETSKGETTCPLSLCGNVTDLWWFGTSIVFARREGPADARTAFYIWKPGDARLRLILTTDDAMFGCQQLEADLLCARETATRPRHLVRLAIPSGKLGVVFDPNPEVAGIRLGAVRRVTVKNAFGLDAYADVVLPPGHVTGERLPLVIVQYESRGFLRGGTADEYPIQMLAAQGMAVLSFNRPPRVAEADPTTDEFEYLRLNFGDWIDYKNMLSSLDGLIDRLIAEGIVDPKRIGITGQSDGATLASYALINSRHRFAAAALSTCCRDPSIMTNLGPAFQAWYRKIGFPSPAGPEDDFWKQGSLGLNPGLPSTPMLIQSAEFEFRMALPTIETLRSRGWPVEMYIFPNEGHVKIQPAHRLAVYERSVDWFVKWFDHASSRPASRLAQQPASEP